MYKYPAFILIYLFSFYNASAYYDFDLKLQSAYHEIIELRMDAGQALINEEKIEKPGNALNLLFENYIDFLKAFISEEDTFINRLKKNSSFRLDFLQHEKLDINSPFHLYTIAEILLQDAFIRFKSGEYFVAAMEIRKSYRLVRKNEIIYPTFPLNKKLSGTIHALIGAVPKEYRWLVTFAGLEGTIPEGEEELKKLFGWVQQSPYSCFKEEILFYLSNIQLAFSETGDQGGKLLLEMLPYCSHNQLIRLSYVSLAMKHGKNEAALSVLTGTNSQSSEFPVYFLRYKLAQVKLQQLDFSAANDFQYFLRHFRGRNYIKSAYQKLAWIQLLQNNEAKYKMYIDSCLTTGQSRIDEDKGAMEEAVNSEIPNRILLRSRLLFDGGYFRLAWNELSLKNADSFPRFRDQLELTYRYGRIMQKLNFNSKAIAYFKETYDHGNTSHYYFAANSVLQLGSIYELSGEIEIARENYLKCLAMGHHDYQNSIDQKARAGLDRIQALQTGKNYKYQ